MSGRIAATLSFSNVCDKLNGSVRQINKFEYDRWLRIKRGGNNFLGSENKPNHEQVEKKPSQKKTTEF